MAEQYRFFGSAEGDTRQYNQTEFAEVLSRLLKNGYFPEVDNELEVVASDPADMTVEVKSGQAWINGYWYKNDTNKVLNINPAHTTLNRIDRVVLRLDVVTDRIIEALVIQGTAASNPIAPALTRTSQIYEISLAQVYIAAGATSIEQAAINDERDNVDVCGKAVPYYVPTNDDISNTAEPNKFLRLDNNGVLPADITGDANSVGGYTKDHIRRDDDWLPGEHRLFYDTVGYSDYESSNYGKIKEVKVANSGIVRIKFNMYTRGSKSATLYGRIYVNGNPVGAERIYNFEYDVSDRTSPTYTEDIPVNKGDLIQIYGRIISGGSFPNSLDIQNFEILVGSPNDIVAKTFEYYNND